MNKKNYIKPSMDVVELRQTYLICTSPDPDPDPNPAPRFNWDEDESFE